MVGPSPEPLSVPLPLPIPEDAEAEKESLSVVEGPFEGPSVVPELVFLPPKQNQNFTPDFTQFLNDSPQY